MKYALVLSFLLISINSAVFSQEIIIKEAMPLNSSTIDKTYQHTHSPSEIKLPDLGSSSSLALTEKEEEKIGRSIIKQLNSSLQLIEDIELKEYLNNLGLRLVEQTDYAYKKFHFFLLNSPQINAFATPGGIVTIYSGLFLSSESESELASVLAHEIAHITQLHIARAIEKAQGMDLPVTLGLIAAVLLGASTSSDAGIAALTGLNAFAYQQQINFTRSNEVEADSVGIQTLAKAGLNPFGMPDFFQRLQKKNQYLEGVIPEFLRTHPITINRLSDAFGRAKQYAKGTNYIKKGNINFALMKAKLDVLSSTNPHLIRQKYSKLSQQYPLKQKPEYTYAHALTLHNNQQFGQAIEKYKQLIMLSPQQNIYKMALSQSLLASAKDNNQELALSILKSSIENNPYDKALNVYYADALIQTKHYKQSINIIKNYLEYAQADSRFFQLLSRAYNGDNKPILSAIAHADYLLSTGELKQALHQLEIAQKLATGNFYQLSLIGSKIKLIENKQEKIKKEK